MRCGYDSGFSHGNICWWWLCANQRQEMVDVAESSDNGAPFYGRVSDIEASEKATAGIQIGYCFGRRLQPIGSVEPLQQARLKILQDGQLGEILPGSKL
jgi:hypothetical protein